MHFEGLLKFENYVWKTLWIQDIETYIVKM